MEKEQVAVDEAVETVAEQNTRAYSKTVWNESTPITADKLNKIENGIASALPLTGGTLTGNVVLNNDKALGGKDASGNIKWLAWVDRANSAQFGDTGLKSVINSRVNPEVNIGGQGIYTLYHTGNKPTPAEIAALPLSGGTLTGNVVLENNMAIGGKDTSGTVKWLTWVDLSDNANFGDTGLKSVINSSVNPEVNISGKGLCKLYHTGNKPTPSEIGALASTGGTLTGDLTCNQYLNINAWSGYGTGQANIWFDAKTANNKTLKMGNVDNIALSKGNVYHPGNKPTAWDIGAMSSNAPTFQGNMIQAGPGGRDWIYHINADLGTLNIAPHNNGNNDWSKQILFDRNGQMFCNGGKKVPTMDGNNPSHYMFRYGSGLGGANGYITFSY